jgi:hypothetical protein
MLVPPDWIFRGFSQERNGEPIPTQAFTTNGEKRLYQAQPVYQLLPGAWINIFADFFPPEGHVIRINNEKKEYNLAIRLFTPSGPIDYPFRNRNGE